MSISPSLDCPPLLVGESQNCTGRGICISSTVCLCTEPGWTGFGDFAFESPTCGVYVPAVQALYGICVVSHFLLLLFTLYFLRIKLRQKKSTNKVFAAVFSLMNIMVSLCFITIGLMRILNPTSIVIGTDRAATVLYCIGSSLTWLSIHLVTYNFIKLNIEKVMNFTHTDQAVISIPVLKLVLSVTAVLSFIACWGVIGMVNTTNSDEMLAFGRLHNFGLAVTTAALGFFIGPFLTRRMRAELNKVLADTHGILASNNNTTSSSSSFESAAIVSPLRKLERKLLRFEIELKRNIVFQICSMILPGAWPFLLFAGSSYSLPLAWTSAVFIFCLMIYINLPVTNGTTSVVSRTRPSQKSAAIVMANNNNKSDGE